MNIARRSKSVPYQNSPWNREEYQELSIFLLKERGFSFKGYKPAYITRRLATRINNTRAGGLGEYLRRLKRDPGELDLLYNALTVNVSSFFRNREVFDALKTRVLPEMVRRKKKRGEYSLKIWSLGCSTGEEPYSLNILLRKSLGFRLKGFDIEIIATDIDEAVLARAGKGSYAADKFADNDSAILHSSFRKRGDFFQIRDRFREGISFQKHDIRKFESMQTNFDLIMCRNVMIYFTKKIHLETYRYLADHLPLHGVLVLGKAEVMLFPKESLFEHIDLENRIYRKIQRA